MKLLLAFLLGAGAAVSPARAEGTLPLSDVLEAVKSSPQLSAELKSALEQQKINADDVVCVGARHGNQWTFLGGARAAPYECEMGPREIRIDADRTYFDQNGKSLGNLKQASPKRAKTFREDNFRWQWKS